MQDMNLFGTDNRDEQYQKVLEMVKRCGAMLELVKNQTPELCMAAVESDGLALQYVKNHCAWRLFSRIGGHLRLSRNKHQKYVWRLFSRMGEHLGM